MPKIPTGRPCGRPKGVKMASTLVREKARADTLAAIAAEEEAKVRAKWLKSHPSTLEAVADVASVPIPLSESSSSAGSSEAISEAPAMGVQTGVLPAVAGTPSVVSPVASVVCAEEDLVFDEPVNPRKKSNFVDSGVDSGTLVADDPVVTLNPPRVSKPPRVSFSPAKSVRPSFRWLTMNR